MRLMKTLVFGVAAALLLWGPSVAMAAPGRWIKEGKGNGGIYETNSGWQEYMPGTRSIAHMDLRSDLGTRSGHFSAPNAPMNAAQKETGARIARDFRQAFQAIGL